MGLLRASTLFAGVVLPLAVTAAGCGKVTLSLNGPAGDGGASSGGSSSGGPGSLASRKPIVIDKVDLLLMIDNSASMGDKQAYLEQVVPELVTRLVTPNCIDASGNVTGLSDSNGNCASSASTPEFPPVHDMHVGIVSSSLGPRLGDQAGGGACLPQATVPIGTAQVPDHNDDEAHLLTRASTSLAGAAASCMGGACPAYPATDTLTDAPDGFLEWFPNVSANTGATAGPGAPAIVSATTLETDFSDLVSGVQQFGCGIESQLESWYRFLIQPDPYASLALTNGTSGTAQWVGVDAAILQQRRDFLRPDSAVVIVDLTDENDSEIDVRSIGGQGYYFMSTAFDPARGTAACATNPADPGCISCDNVAAKGDPNCPSNPAEALSYSSPTDWGYDLNLRHVHMKQKYGIDPQYPIERYVTGLTSSLVPDRAGEYPSGAPSYVGNLDCVNPLFAGALPDQAKLSSGAASATTLSASDQSLLCNLPAGTRPGNAVFYLHIGGVPNQLVTTAASDGTLTPKTTLSDADWVKILGTDPESFNYNGIDPHMIESYAPRTAQPDGTPWPFTLAAPIAGESAIQPPTAANGSDPWSGREWITNVGPHADLNVDRQYACIFPLTTPRDCTLADNKLACDCSTKAGVLTAEQTSPVCDAVTPTQQDYAKAYPTVRELLLAKKLGAQGAVASICPIDVQDNAAGDDPVFGYRPAMGVLLSRMAPTLAYRGE